MALAVLVAACGDAAARSGDDTAEESARDGAGDTQRVAREASGDVDSSLRDSATTAQVRFMNAVPHLPALDVRLGDGATAVTTDAGVVTQYRPLAPGDLHVVLSAVADGAARANPRDSGAAADAGKTAVAGSERAASVAPGDTLAVRRETLVRGGRYTVIGMPSDDGEGVTVRVVSDNWLEEPAAAQVRVIHAAALAGQFDLLLVGTNTSIFDNVSFANATPFQRLAPSASQRLALRQDSHPDQLSTVPTITRLDAGRAYTIVITGRRDSWDVITLIDDTRMVAAGRTRTPPDAGRGGRAPRAGERP